MYLQFIEADIGLNQYIGLTHLLKKYFSRLLFNSFLLTLFGAIPSIAFADIIDDITVHTDSSGEVDLVIKFNIQIQYLRNFPQGKTSFSSIYFNALNTVPDGEWLNYESHRAPPSTVIQDIAVSTIDKATGPTVQLKFFNPQEISVSLGRNNQSLVIHIKPEVSATPAGSVSTAPSGEVILPKVELPTSALKSIHIPLGGKDGLPIFPDIDQPVPLTVFATSETPTLLEQITRANNQAASLMIQGGNALLTGQSFSAIETFNSILKLPTVKYTEDAQLWIGIARERVGQLSKAIIEYNTYLKIHPNGKWSKWVKDRLALLKISQPALFMVSSTQIAAPAPVKNTEFQYSEFGSLSAEYYLGASQTNTIATVGTVQTPTSISATDQKSLMTNVNMTARANNNEYDNRLVFQDFYAANYLPGQANNNRLGAAYYEIKDRVENYSFKIGRQSGLGGGVMGRFDGISAGIGLYDDYKVNMVAGQLSDVTIDQQPQFTGVSLDFGLKSTLGGSLYYINQTVDGFTDRRAVGGNLRYFEPTFSIMSMIDYDLQFQSLNIMTIQGTINGGGKGNDYNFLLDRRRSPILDIRNAISGTTTSLATLVQNGWSTADLLMLANQRTTTTDSAAVGMINHLSEKWIAGTDISVFITDGQAASGTLLPDGSTGLEGFVAASTSTGPAWTFAERLTGMGIFQSRDVTNFSVSYTRTETTSAEGLQFSNHSDIAEKWTFDSTIGLTLQADNIGGKTDNVSPTTRVSYKLKSYLTLDSQLGLTWTKTSSSLLQTSSRTFQDFLSCGFRFDF